MDKTLARADHRDEVIAAQQDEIAALRRALQATAGNADTKRLVSPQKKKTPKFAEQDGVDDDYAFYDMDISRLVRPSDLLTGQHVGHNFKHIMSDFSEMQRRILKRVLGAGEKRERVRKYLEKLQILKQKVVSEATDAHKQAQSSIRSMQAELDKVEEALFAHLKRVEKANIDGINEQIAFCDSLISDIDEGLELGKEFLAENKNDSEAKPLQLIQSVEVGLDELQEATIRKKPQLQPFGVVDPTPVFAAFRNMSFRPREIDDSVVESSWGPSDLKANHTPAYERLHRIAVRKRIETLQASVVTSAPFSSYPTSPSKRPLGESATRID